VVIVTDDVFNEPPADRCSNKAPSDYCSV